MLDKNDGTHRGREETYDHGLSRRSGKTSYGASWKVIKKIPQEDREYGTTANWSKVEPRARNDNVFTL